MTKDEARLALLRRARQDELESIRRADYEAVRQKDLREIAAGLIGTPTPVPTLPPPLSPAATPTGTTAP